MNTDADRFLSALARGMPADERLIMCGFEGDPNKADRRSWKPWPWSPGKDIPFGRRANGYVTVASFGKAPDATFRRRTATFAAGRALMVDDIGTKIDAAQTTGWPAPSAIVETSPGNHQWWYMLKAPERDRLRFDGVIRAFIASQLLGKDPGMAGVTRVGRLPGYTNAKPQHDGWLCKLHDLNASRFSIDDLLKAFGLTIPGVVAPLMIVEPGVARDRMEAFKVVRQWLYERDMLRRFNPDLGGWIEGTCPWIGNHTDSADTGFAIRVPAADNGYYGAARCHHGHCEGKGWRELTEWIANAVAEELQAVNAAAPATLAELRRGHH